MTRRIATLGVELLAAALLVAAAFWCWNSGLHTSDFPPYTKGVAVQPITYYSGPWITAAVGCATLAGLLLVDGGRRYRR